MNQKAQMMLKALMSRSEHDAELSHFFNAKLLEKLALLQAPQDFTPKVLFSSTAWLKEIHFSWLSQIIQSYPQALQPFFLALLTEKQARGIEEAIPLQAKNLSPFLEPYLAYLLRSELMEPDLLNEHHLPESPLTNLLHLPRKDLIHLCDLLGIYDLATDLRQIVDKGLIAKIYSVLSVEQRKFLEYCSRQSMKWISPKLGLLSWNGSKQQLNKLLHQRGLIRLAKAVAHESGSFKWHLLHHLDTGRAKIIQKEFYKKQEPSFTAFFKDQVLHITKKIHSPQGTHFS